MKLVFAFVRLGESKLTAAVADPKKLRVINFKWSSRDEPFLPPKTWAATVKGEAEYQRGEEVAGNPLRNLF